jgi:IclR family mhp operon transcriptional activator
MAKAMSLEQAAQKYLAPLQKVAAQIESRMTEEEVFTSKLVLNG